MQQFPQSPNFEVKHGRPNEIATAAAAAKFVMDQAANNAKLGLWAQIEPGLRSQYSVNQPVNYYSETAVPSDNLSEYGRLNEVAQPAHVATEYQPTTLIDEAKDPEELDRIREGIDQIHADLHADAPTTQKQEYDRAA